MLTSAECRAQADGFGTRFGLLYVDRATQQRTQKLSASFYREVAAQNRLV
jgi:beta-glucosidase